MHTAEDLIRQLRAPDQRGVGRVEAIESGPSNVNRLAELDGAAVAVRVFDSTVVPGNLQMPEYSDAVIRTAHPHLSTMEVRRRVIRKEIRARALLRRLLTEDFGNAWFVMGERAITQCIHLDDEGRVHSAQLQHLLRLADHEKILIQVLPESVVTPGLADQFSLYRLVADHRVGYVETIMGSWYSTRMDDVAKLHSTFSNIAGEAMSPQSTKQFIREVLGSWRSARKQSPESTEETPSSSVPTVERVTTALESQERLRAPWRMEP